MIEKFAIEYHDIKLIGDIYGSKPQLLILHGAGTSNRNRYNDLRTSLLENEISTVAFDFIGHGETSGDLGQSSLRDRTNQALTIIDKLKLDPINILGSSMSGYTAIKLTELVRVKNLILSVPAVYNRDVYDSKFDSSFRDDIRQPQSWQHTDAWNTLSKFRGNLLIYSGGLDTVIPSEVIEKIFNAAGSSKKELVKFEQATHQINLYMHEHPEELDRLVLKIKEFIL